MNQLFLSLCTRRIANLSQLFNAFVTISSFFLVLPHCEAVLYSCCAVAAAPLHRLIVLFYAFSLPAPISQPSADYEVAHPSRKPPDPESFLLFNSSTRADDEGISTLIVLEKTMKPLHSGLEMSSGILLPI